MLMSDAFAIDLPGGISWLGREQGEVDSTLFFNNRPSVEGHYQGDTRRLPRFTKDQQRFVVANLIEIVPHRKIAKKVKELFPEFAADMDQAAYEKAFIKRGVVPKDTPGGSCNFRTTYGRLVSPYHQSACPSRQRGGIHLWSFAEGRIRGVASPWQCVAGGDASGRSMEGLPDAFTLCKCGNCQE